MAERRPPSSHVDPPLSSFASSEQPDAVGWIIEEMAAAFERGERPRAEEYLVLHPELSEEDAVRLVYEEACLREDVGETGVSTDILTRFAQWREPLGLLLECNRLLRHPELALPSVGEELGDFRLIAELGRGAVGRTFLAAQHSLADRPIVIKVSYLGQEEHLHLARLQHMSIVPLFFEQVFPERNLQVIGMPYVGGASLWRILEAIGPTPPAQRKGTQILDELDRAEVHRVVAAEHPGPFRTFLARASFTEAICLIGACLADALQYAHDRGLVHFDVKPSNVLIAGDGQPMLLDFHLARPPYSPGQPLPERFGGTPGYTPPEQLAAIEALRDGKAPPGGVDGRCDQFALGVLLLEALSGHTVARTDSAESLGRVAQQLHRINPTVSRGLADIIQQCLDPDPENRYPSAQELGADLRRHLNDQPLRGVRNRSPLERWRKWRRRSPARLVQLGFLAVMLGVGGWAYQSWQSSDQVLRGALIQARELLGRGRAADAQEVLTRVAPVADRLPFDDAIAHEYHGVVREAQRVLVLDEFSRTIDVLRFRLGLEPLSPEEARGLYRRGMEIWKVRETLALPGEPVTVLPGRPFVSADLLDLATILADLRIQMAEPSQRDDARADAVSILRDAAARYGESPALLRDLEEYSGKPATPRGSLPKPKTAWESYHFGRSFLRSGDLERASSLFRNAIAQSPGEFWPYFCLAVCQVRLGRLDAALPLFDVCVALAPRTAECYYNRARVHQARNHEAAAREDYTRALDLNPRFTHAAINRGGLDLRAGELERAMADFDLAASHTEDARDRARIEYNRGLVYLARHDLPAARASLRKAVAAHDADAARLLERLDRESAQPAREPASKP